MTDLDIGTWLMFNPRDSLTAAAGHARTSIGGRLGECVAVILLEHIGDEYPDPNIHELAHTLIQQYTTQIEGVR